MSCRWSKRNPPSTGYQRPEERKFFIWQDRTIDYGNAAKRRGWERHPWRWLCTMCEPPAQGFRVQKGAWQRIITVSLPHHFRTCGQHHDWVAGNPQVKERGSSS